MARDLLDVDSYILNLVLVFFRHIFLSTWAGALNGLALWRFRVAV